MPLAKRIKMMNTTAAKLLLPPDTSIKKDLSEIAVSAVLKAGKIQRQYFGNESQPEIILPKDLKMAVDRECENAIVDVIRSHFPRHRILAEEGGNLGGDDDYLWIIDPLDGTVNFFHGLSQFCVCVACCYLPADIAVPDNGNTLADCTLVGAIYAPLMDELYVGIAGEGATCNGKMLSCSPHKELSELIIAFSLGKTESGIDRMTDLCRVLARKARKLRSFGSAGLDIVQVASGRLGGVFYRGIHIWDIAAAGIILKEAGGMIKAAVQPNGKWNIIASAPGVHQELVNITSKPEPFV
jgi:fructose-1,6-bisphosphatase/inositol monophosphatase family enzyme